MLSTKSKVKQHGSKREDRRVVRCSNSLCPRWGRAVTFAQCQGTEVACFLEGNVLMHRGGGREVISEESGAFLLIYHSIFYAARADLAVPVKERWEEMRKVKQPT